MKDIFTSFGNEDENDIEPDFDRISFDDGNSKEPVSQFEDIDSGRIFSVNQKNSYDFGVIENGFQDVDSGKDRDYSSLQSGDHYSSDYFDKLSEDISFESHDYENPSNDFEIPHESTADEFENKERRTSRSKNKNISSGGKKNVIIAALICCVIVLLIAIFGYIFHLCSKADYRPETHIDNGYISEKDLYSKKNVTNILIIGTDKRESDSTYRSDTMILASLDKKHKKLKLTSFLRDSYLYIPAKDYSTKLNAACSYGGPQMVIDTIEYNFKIHIDKYVMIDFDIFKTIISDLGGVTLTITKEEAACIERESGLKCKSGTHNYRARLALWYARIRHLDSDFKRTERQRKVIQAVIKKIKKSDIVTLNKMFSNALPLIQTDLSPSELFALGFKAAPFLKYETEEMQVPAAGTWSNATIKGQDVLRLDVEKNSELVKEFIYGTK